MAISRLHVYLKGKKDFPVLQNLEEDSEISQVSLEYPSLSKNPLAWQTVYRFSSNYSSRSLEWALVYSLTFGLDISQEGAEKSINEAEGKVRFNKIFEGKEIKRGICGLILNHPEVGYRCYDCQKSNACIICRSCFENSDHTGHRIEVRVAYNGMCDCGDIEVWKEQGNCTNHTGYIQEDSYIPGENKERFVKAI